MGKGTLYIKASNIRKDIEKRGLTYEQCAHILGNKTRSSFEYFINGKTPISIWQAFDLCAYFNRPFSYYFSPPKPKSNTKKVQKQEASAQEQQPA